MEEGEKGWQDFGQSLNPGQAFKRSYPPLTPSPPPGSENKKDDGLMPVTPFFQDTINYRDGKPGDVTLSPAAMKKTALEQVLDTHPDAMMDIMDADSSFARTAPNDYRPNRVIKGSTRTTRVVRRTGLYNSSKHRDQIITRVSQSRGVQHKSQYAQKVAAEKIQRVWRSWFKYCQENSDWMTTTWICATMIQARWRSYHVRRQKLDRAARTIQRHIRGLLVRKTLQQHRAAVIIQRRVIGILTRAQLRCMHQAAVKMQSLARSAQARKRVRAKREFMTKTVLLLQCAIRRSIAKRRVKAVRAQRRRIQEILKAVIDIQRCLRGRWGRKRAATRQEQYGEDLHRHRAATKLQSMARRDNASKRVDNIRAERLDKMNRAATFLRKMYLGAKTRKRYKGLVNEFRTHEAHIVTIQRYARGFLVRLRMWREAIRAEEELWAVLEIQRVWRGYHGRVRWETSYEHIWRQEMAAVALQTLIRGWLARARVTRTRRKIARSEFERARRRFRAAQRIQALARAVLVRKGFVARQQRVLGAVVSIQRIARGHALRVRLWHQVIDLRATMVTAAVRGFLVRNRRFHLVAKVIFIQRKVRQWQRLPQDWRDLAFGEMQDRKDKATKIQDAFRKRHERTDIAKIQEADLNTTQPIPSS